MQLPGAAHKLLWHLLAEVYHSVKQAMFSQPASSQYIDFRQRKATQYALLEIIKYSPWKDGKRRVILSLETKSIYFMAKVDSEPQVTQTWGMFWAGLLGMATLTGKASQARVVQPSHSSELNKASRRVSPTLSI